MHRVKFHSYTYVDMQEPKYIYSGTPAMDTSLVWTPRLSGRLPSDSFDFPIGAHSKRASVKWTPRVYGQWTKIAALMYYRI